jgi:riboflavin kinase/FMN adenylyltransferase
LEVVRGTAALTRKLVRPVLTIGNFDGLHVGHRAIMATVVERARAHDGEAVVYTFHPHPRKVVQPDRPPKLLTTLDQKLELLESFGVDVTILEPFDTDFMKLPPEEFVSEYIHARIDPVELYVGYDFHFGHDREGSMRLLTETGPRLGFAVTVVPEVTIGKRDVNSTRIRELLELGEVEEVKDLLGRPFSVRGRVQEGHKRGASLGFPTANVPPENEVLPRNGVYAGEILFLDTADSGPAQGERLPVVTNVGVRPTFDDDQGVLAEAHVIDFEGDLYGREVEVSFAHHLRAEQRFDGPEPLKAQIAVDVQTARQKLGIA